VVNLLLPVSRRGWNIIVHPNVIYTPKLWAPLGKRLLIETWTAGNRWPDSGRIGKII